MLKTILLAGFLFANLFAGDVSVKDAYVRAVPPNLPNSAAFLKIINDSDKTIFLESASSSVAKNLELHEHTMSNGMMKMQQVKNIKIPARSIIELKSGGFHIMLLGLNKKLKVDDSVEAITLNFSDNTSITLQNVPVKSVMMGMKHK